MAHHRGSLASYSAQYVLDNPSSSSMDAFLASAQTINGGRRHARSSRFSTHLTGRFYRNSTLEAHVSRKRRAARMRAKKRELEQAIVMEERRFELLEETLRERKEQCRRIQQRRLRAAVTIQCLVRRREALTRAEGIRRWKRATEDIACFCQVRYHGGKARDQAKIRRMQVAQRNRETHASIRIQFFARSCAAKRVLGAKRDEFFRNRKRNAAACTIQSITRMRQCRQKYTSMIQEKRRQLRMRQEAASTIIQSIQRRNLAKIEAERRRCAKREEESKPKRVPLHRRRYSTYSVSQQVAEARQRAVARVAKKGRMDRRERNTKEDVAIAAKARVAKLEERRKLALQKTRKAAAIGTKQSKFAEKKDRNKIVSNVDCEAQQAPTTDDRPQDPPLPKPSPPTSKATLDRCTTDTRLQQSARCIFTRGFEASFDQPVLEREDDI